jgi:predicted RecB family nuclease
MSRFDTGHRVGEVARSLYPEGRLINHVDDLAAALAETQAALAGEGDLMLFEPAFRHGDVLVRADLLFRRQGRYRLVEVKAATEVKDHHLQDAAIHAWVIEGAGYPVDGASIAHVNSNFVYRGGLSIGDF